MRIALVIFVFPKLSETFLINKFVTLVDRKWDAHIVCTQSVSKEWLGTDALRERDDLRARVHVAWPHRPRWLAVILFVPRLVLCFFKNPTTTIPYLLRGWQRFGTDVLRRFYLDADLISLGPGVIHFEFGTLAAERMHLKDLLETKILVSFRGYDLNHVGLEKKEYYKNVWARADAIHVLGQDLWNRAMCRGCPPSKPHALIPPAINVNEFDPGDRCHKDITGQPGRPLRILSVGRLDWKKGLEYGLQSIKCLLDHNCHCEYRIIGDGEHYECLAFARHQFELEKEVILLGACDRNEIKAQMLWADVFLHPAVSEGFSNAVIEAQAMMLPVVCTDAGGLPENVVDSETGFVVPRRDPEALADKLTVLARSPSCRQKMGQAGRERAMANFRLEGQIQKFECLYKQIFHAKS